MNLPKLFITFLLGLLAGYTFAQDKAVIADQIKADYKKINSYNGLRLVHIDRPSGQTTDGGEELTGYFKDDTLCKITYFLGLSFRNRHVEYYLTGNHVFFVYDAMDQLDADDKLSSTLKFVRKYEARYYLANGQVIDKIIKGSVTPNPLTEIYTEQKIAGYRKLLLRKFLQLKQ